MLCPSTCKGGQSTVLTSEEEAMLTERLIHAGKRGFAVGKDKLNFFDCRLLQTEDQVGKTGYPLKMLFGHSEPDIEKLPSEMPRTRTDENLGEKASITLKDSSKV